MTAPHCPQHPDVRLRCPACAGRLGGRVSSPAKAAAARKNAQKSVAARVARKKTVAQRAD